MIIEFKRARDGERDIEECATSGPCEGRGLESCMVWKFQSL
jgi:hypothetical protein